MSKIQKGKNPFYTVSDWDAKTLESIKINVGNPIETTSDFTKSKKPAARYWSSKVTFSYVDSTGKEFNSSVIKMGPCDIPYVPGNSYGGDYFYANVNADVIRAIAHAAQEAQLKVGEDDKKLVSTENEKWFTINKAANRFGVLDKNGKFDVKSLHDIIMKTEKGVTATVDVVVNIKCASEDGSARTSRTPMYIILDCSRSVLKSLNNEVPPPSLSTVVEQAPAQRADIATESLMTELEALGL